MKTINSENKLCLLCMEEHEVEMVIAEDGFKYDYCFKADAFLETEDMIRENSRRIRLKLT